jgi:hypothetical protein
MSAKPVPVIGLKSDGNVNHENPWQIFPLSQGHLLRATCKRGNDYVHYAEDNSDNEASNEKIYWELEALIHSFNSNYFDAGLLNSLDE